MGRIFAALVAVAVLAGCGGYGWINARDFTAPAEMSSSDWSDPQELERVWQASEVLLLQPGASFRFVRIGDLEAEEIPGVYPAVIYLHGCAGLGPAAYSRMYYLAEQGYAVIAPDSFAREKYPQSCNPYSRASGMYRGTLPLRQRDLAYVIARAGELGWVDADRMALFGVSEGGLVAATYGSPQGKGALKARVIEGWTCQSRGWPEYRGINAPASQPVLTLVAKYDPWYQNVWTRGDCSEFVNRSNGSRSVVYSEGEIAYGHALFEHEPVQNLIGEFLGARLD